MLRRAEQAIPLPGARALTLPRGVVGEVLALPEGLEGGLGGLTSAAPSTPAASGLWAVGTDGGGPAGGLAAFDPEQLLLVRWQLPLR